MVSKSRVNAAGEELRRYDTEYSTIRRIQCYRLFRIGCLPELLVALAEALVGQPTLLSSRLKRIPSIQRKLLRLETIKLSQVADIVGFRLVCQSLADVSRVRDVLVSLPYDSHVREHAPAPSGYRGTHVELRTKQQLPSGGFANFDVEVQVRSVYQHRWALVSESFGERVKEGGGPAEVRGYLEDLSSVIRDWEAAHPEDVQRQLPELRVDTSVCIVRVPKSKGTRAVIQKYPLGDREALDRLVEWELDLSQGTSQTLLLAYSGDVSTLDTTHQGFLLGGGGVETIELEPWMPRWEMNH